MMNRIVRALALLASILVAGCAGDQPPVTPTPTRPWVEEQVAFTFGPDELHGILTLPASEGPHPAIVIVSGSVNVSTGRRSGASEPWFKDHAREMALHGFAALRYDPPGIGLSSGDSEFMSLERRAEEAAAAIHFLQSRPDIQPDQVGLWGISQGSWVIGMTAAEFPQDVAFVISVSGSGVSVAEQQIHSITAQSKAAQMPEEDIKKAVLFGRLLIDWQLVNPVWRELNDTEAGALGEGPWTRFMALVYEPDEFSPAEGFQQGIEILKAIQDEPWARFLYLKEIYLPQLESIPPEHVEGLKAAVGPTLLNDPKQYLTRVKSPVLAVFGENDLLQPTARSAELYEQYLNQAGNEHFEIVVIPGVGHEFGLYSTPLYLEALSDWLDNLYSE